MLASTDNSFKVFIKRLKLVIKVLGGIEIFDLQFLFIYHILFALFCYSSLK